MLFIKQQSTIALKLPAMLAALAAVSACTTAPTAPTGPTGGAPSSHVPQSYQTRTSTAAITSTMGGSAIVGPLDSTTGQPISLTTVATAGSTTHNTGRLRLDDGTYLFIDPDGPDAFGNVTNGTATGTVGAAFTTDFSAYDYVFPYRLSYPTGGATASSAMSIGVAGMITDGSDMPVAGSASYSGTALAQISNYAPANYVNDLYLDDGVSTVDVNFASGSATVNLANFARITGNGGATVTAAAAAIDQIQGTGLLISGAHFTGGSWVTMKGGSVVNVVGASQTSTGNGTFFGYDPSISAPDEVGGVVVIDGATAVVAGFYIAD